MKIPERNIPVPDPENSDLEYVCPPASWGDMTGLIPYGLNSRAELSSYESLYPYLPDPKGDNEKEEL